MRSFWDRIRMVSRVRARNGSVSFVPAYAKEDAPRLIVTNIDAIRNAEIFLNILPPQSPARFLACSLLNSSVWVGFWMLCEALRLAVPEPRAVATGPSLAQTSFNKQSRSLPLASITYLCSWHTPLASHVGGTPHTL